MGIHDHNTLCHFSGVTHCPWCSKVGQNQPSAQSSTIYGQYIIDWDWCVRSVMAAQPLHQRLSVTTGRKDVNHQGREAPLSHSHWHNHQQKVYRVTPPRGSKGDSSIPWATLSGIAPPFGTALKGDQTKKVPPANPMHPIT